MSLTRDLARLHSDSDGNLILANNLTVDTNTLKVDAANNRVGIGTSTPGNPLHILGGDVGGVVKVEQTVATNTPTMLIKQTGEGGNSNANQGLLIEVDGSNGGDGNIVKATGTNSNLNGGSNVNALVVKNSGNTGIGTDAPLRSLHVSSPGDTGLMLTTSNAATGYRNWEMQAGADGSNQANFIIRTRADNGTGGDEIMRMTKNGDIGLGTSTPNNYTNWKTLTFNGTGTAGGEIDFETQGTLNADIFAGPNNMQIRHLQPTKPIKMYAGGDAAANEAVRLQDGTVMHPNMPYFATRPFYTNSYLANGTVVQFYAPHVNQGNDFNSSTHRFTAPFSGAYYFAFHSNIHRNAVGILYFDWYVNGSSVMGTQGGRIYGYYAGGWENMMGFVVLNLAANDYVELRAGGGSPKVDGGSYGQYIGYMLNTT